MTDAPKPPMSKGQKTATGGAVAALITAATLLASSNLTEPSEGLATKPYWDPAHIRTVCYGETVNVLERIYSREECAAKLRLRMARDYAPQILDCLPELVDQPKDKAVKMTAALVDAAYNAGPVAVCKSRMARSIHAGQWRQACDGFPGWFTTARNRQTGARVALRGLVIRREKEAALCREGLRL